MRLENAIDKLQILDVGTAFIVNDDIEILGPILFFVNRIQVFGTRIRVVSDRPLHIRAAEIPLVRISFCFA